MAQKDSSSRSQSPNSSSDERKRNLKGDDLYSALDDEADEFFEKSKTPVEAQAVGGAADGGEDSQGWRNRVLATYKKNKGPRDTSTLLARIPDGKATYEIGDRHKSVSIQEAMIDVVDRMFDAFQNYGYDFNREAAGTELELNWIRPVLTREPSGGSVFSGRLSTRRWTMVVKGTPQEILSYILPADKLIGFSLSASSFEPYLQLLPSSDGLDVRWKAGRTPVSAEVFPRLYQDLFVTLIRHAQGLVRGQQKFDTGKIGGTVEQVEMDEEQVKQKYRDAFFEDMRSRASSNATTGNTPTVPAERKASKENISGDHKTSDRHSGLHQVTSRMWPQGQPNGWPGQQQKEDSDSQEGMPLAEPPYQGNPRTTGTGWIPPLNTGQHKQMPIAGSNAAAPTPRTAPIAPTSGAVGKPTPGSSSGQTPSRDNNSTSCSQSPQSSWGAPPGVAQNVNANPTSKGNRQAPASSSQTPSASQQPPWPPSPQAGQSQQPFQNLQLQMQQMNQMRQGQSGRSDQSFSSALTNLLDALERELEIVAKAGSDAFSQKDLARADAALKFSARLTEFKATAAELLEYYKRK